MFGLSRQEKLRKKFKTEASYAWGEVTYYGKNPAEILFKSVVGINAGDSQPIVTVKFITADGEEGEISCGIKNRSFTVGERVRVKYIRYEGSLLGIVDTDS